MMAYLANTLVFVIVGVAITEKAFEKFDGIDTLYIIIDYIGVIIIRYIASLIYNGMICNTI